MPRRNGAPARAGSPDRLRVVLFEPIPLIAEALCLFLATQPDIDAVGLSDLAEFLASVGGAAVAVVCFHAWGPEVGAVLRCVRARTDAPLVLLGPNDSTRTPSLRVGRGVSICEGATPEVFLGAIRELTADAGDVLAPPQGEKAQRAFAVLTPREREIISLIAEDLTAHQIASMLRISERTIHSHLRNAYKKLDVHGRVGAVEAARREGLLPRPSVAVAGVS